ncbi:hypothetical protein [Photobacterium nomapromontoriensis]|uniref:hypothetical protein n=1 Tax=Photobacterium nomapromontoriensis TaxID=2910237 RepID=UPI003D0EAC6F
MGGIIISGNGTVLIGDAAPITSAPAKMATSSASGSTKMAAIAIPSIKSDNLSANTIAEDSARTEAQNSVGQCAEDEVKQEIKWIKLRACHRDLWDTPIYAEGVEIMVDGDTFKKDINLEKGVSKSSYSSSRDDAANTTHEAGTYYIPDLPPSASKVVVIVNGQSGIEQQIQAEVASLQADMDGLYRDVVDSMTGFQELWDERGVLSFVDGIEAGGEAWASDTKDLFDLETWENIGNILDSALDESVDFLHNYAKDRFDDLNEYILDSEGRLQTPSWLLNKLSADIRQEILNANGYIDDKFDDLSDLGEKTAIIIKYQKEILNLPNLITSRDIDGIERFIDTVLFDIDPDWSKEVKENENYPIIMQLLQDHNVSLTYIAYIDLIIEGIPPSFYVYYAGKGGAYICIELILTLILSFLTLGVGAAAQAANWSAKFSRMATTASKVKSIPNSARALNVFISIIEAINKSNKKLKNVGVLMAKRPIGKFTSPSDDTLDIRKDNIKRDKHCRLCQADHATPRSLMGEVNYV